MILDFVIGLLKQFQSSWKMLVEGIEKVSDKNWTNFEDNWGFVENVYHIIETAEFYNGITPKNFPWGIRANIDWDKDNDQNIRVKKYSKLTKYSTNILSMLS